MPRKFDIQGHRGCRGLRPESTLPGFELALDLGVTTLELDLHFTKDQVPVIWHDPTLELRFLGAHRGPKPPRPPVIAQSNYAELRWLVLDGNPNPALWNEQRPEAGPASRRFVSLSGESPPSSTLDKKEEERCAAYQFLRLADLFAFVAAYAGELGEAVGKSAAQRARAKRVLFNVETKRHPKQPENICDGFDGVRAGPFEKAILQVVQQAGVFDRFVLQSFDHRSLRAAKKEEPKLRISALYGAKLPENWLSDLKEMRAEFFSPNYQALTEPLVAQVRGEGIQVVPYTINEPAVMDRLLDWEADGIITDYPNRLIPRVQARHWDF